MQQSLIYCSSQSCTKKWYEKMCRGWGRERVGGGVWVSVKRKVLVGAGVAVHLFLKEYCFRVRVRVRVTASVNRNPNPNLNLTQHSLKKKKIDPEPAAPTSTPTPRFTDTRGGWWSVAVIVKEMLTCSLWLSPIFPPLPPPPGLAHLVFK